MGNKNTATPPPSPAQSQWDNHNMTVAALPTEEPGEWQRPAWPIPGNTTEDKQFVATGDETDDGPATFDIFIDTITGKEVHTQDEEPGEKEIQESLHLAFREMHRLINEEVASRTAKPRPQPIPWPYPPEAAGKKISATEAEKIAKYIKGLPAGNNVGLANPVPQSGRNNDINSPVIVAPQDHTKVILPPVAIADKALGRHYYISSKVFNAIIEWLREQDHHMAGKQHLDVQYDNTHGISFYAADAHNNDETRGGIPDAMVDVTDLIMLLTAHAGNESGSRVFDATASAGKALDFLHQLLDNTITKGHEGKAKAELNAIFDEEKRRQEAAGKEKDNESIDKENRQVMKDTINWWGTGLLAEKESEKLYKEVDPAPGKTADQYPSSSPVDEDIEITIKK